MKRYNPALNIILLLSFALLQSCNKTSFISVPCTPRQTWPYPEGIPYVGIHAGMENNDIVSCSVHNKFKQDWHSLEGKPIPQPNTFSPDGSVVYVTTSPTSDDPCSVYALSADNGKKIWCRNFGFNTSGSSIEVDEDGYLYFTSGITVVSLYPDGSDRWATPLPVTGGVQVDQDLAIGLHFTPGGHIATVTNSGVVSLLERNSGKVLSYISLPDAFGFVPLATPPSNINLLDVMPSPITLKITSLMGSKDLAGKFFDWFFGSSGGFVDNTIGVSPNNELYIIGGGPDDKHGSLMQVKITGTVQPSLEAGWYVVVNGGSATSPSISSNGKYINFGDGSSVLNLIAPSTEARLYTVDIEACNNNTDSYPDPSSCAPIWSIPLKKGALAGSVPIEDDGSTYVWETNVSSNIYDTQADISAYDSNGNLKWEVELNDGLSWTSVITVTDNYLVGTATRVIPSDEKLLSVKLPDTVESFLIALDKSTGSEIFRTPVPDDASSTVTIGPDGSIYVNMLGIFGIFSLNHDIKLGIARYRPYE